MEGYTHIQEYRGRANWTQRAYKESQNCVGRQEGVMDLGEGGEREVNMNRIHCIKISKN